MRTRLSPILVKEMRSTMRGVRTFLAITLFLLFLMGASLLVYYITLQNSGPSAAFAGRTIFGFLSFTEFLMLAMVTPALTAGAVAGERQRQTFDMLMATPLTPGKVLRGKLWASMNYLFLLMFASLPINSLVFLFGGVTPSALIWWVTLMVVVLLMLGTLGLMMSTLFKNSGVATAAAYLVALLLFVIVPGGLILTTMALSRGGQAGGCFAASVALLHPAASLMAIIIDDELNAGTLLPASLPLFGALAGLFFLTAEARLSSLVGRRWRRILPIIGLVMVAVVAAGYIVAFPAQALCT